jgi:hypothetical protein
MKSYRCVFSYAGGNTTIDVVAGDGDLAIEAAASAITAGDYDRVEVWDGDTLVLARTTPRAWDALGDTSPGDAPLPEPIDAAPEQPQTAPLTHSHPRRAPTLFAASLRALGFSASKARAPNAATRKN